MTSSTLKQSAIGLEALKAVGSELYSGLFKLVTIRPDDAVAYLWGWHGWFLSLQLVGKERGIYQVMHPSRTMGVGGLAMLSDTLLLYTNPFGLMQLDLSPTIFCNHYPFLASSLSPFPVPV